MHCGTDFPESARTAPFCCAGCRAVNALIVSSGLTRYYDLAGARGAVPATPPPRGRSFAWLEPIIARAESIAGTVAVVDLDVQGIHCAACVWLMNELFRRRPGGVRLTVNPAIGKARVLYRRGTFDLVRFLAETERFGYVFGPSRKRAAAASRDLAMRLGVCVAATMNLMLFSLSFYVGLAPSDGDLFALFSRLSLALAAVIVAVGGWPFFRSAARALASGVLHLDLPIAIGILLAFGASVAQAQSGRGDHAYLDTLAVFVTLMLVGRWLQERVLERNRRFLLDDDGAEGILVRCEKAGALALIAAPAVRAGDRLVVAPGDLVPVEATLRDEAALITTDWVNGESAPRRISRGDTIPAGAFAAGRVVMRVEARSAFSDSELPALLAAKPAGGGRARVASRLTDSIARRYVVTVVSVAAFGLLAWLPAGAERALDVTVALLVVTCPCALGIAVPLAYELSEARLRRAGLFVRTHDFLDRLFRVRKVLFDKTGTLTLGRLELVGSVTALPPDARDAAYDMAARSSHPASRCLAAELERVDARFFPEAAVMETPGEGLSLERDGRVFRLGAGRDADRVRLSADGATIATFEMREAVRTGARGEVGELVQDGIDVWIVSGDSEERVAAMADVLGVPADRALARQGPTDKAALVARLDRADTLFVGDGVNDSLAFERAYCAGTPSIGRPVMPAKSDFFLLGDGIGAISAAFETARRLHATVRRILALALCYNTLAVAASLAGLMTPLAAAIAMPASSVTTLLVAAAALSARRNGTAQRAPSLEATPFRGTT